ncbi:MAG: hypothetical protein R2780_07735 [Crocinitomicaceae bacterium]|nr:hypothetical protein [Crocinitomicaceae bacterium]
MKRIILSSLAIAAIALTSCKKDEVETIELGEATISGTIRADIDQTNDLNGAGLYEQYYSPEGAAGMTVRAFVDTKKYYQSPDPNYNYDIEVYTAVTDANGSFTLTIPATQEGFDVNLEFEDVYGVTRKLYTSNGSSLTEESYLTMGDTWEYIYDGANLNVVYDANIYPVNNNANQYGSATVSGTVYAVIDNGATPSGSVPLNTASGFGGKEVIFTWDNPPYGNGGATQIVVTIDANGDYTATIPTMSAGNGSVDIFVGMLDFTGDFIYYNTAFTADSTWSARYYLSAGVYNCGPYGTYNSIGLSDGDIVPGVDLYFNTQLLP